MTTNRAPVLLRHGHSKKRGRNKGSVPSSSWPVVHKEESSVSDKRGQKPYIEKYAKNEEATSCYYCHQAVGEPHGRECVSVVKTVEIIWTLKTNKGHDVTFAEQRMEPHSFDEEQIEWALNEAMCLDYLVEGKPDLKLLSAPEGFSLSAELKNLLEERGYLSGGPLRAKFAGVLDATPRIK